jgi:23S rRNA pseudouridine2605 synthase
LQGRVTVDGQVIRELGTKASPEADIRVDGEAIRRERTLYLAVSKPKGYVSTNEDPSGRPRVVDLVAGVSERVYTVGRLDEDSTGLMILTNDGELANRLAHPRYGVEKVYRATVAGKPGPEVLDKLTQGVWLAEGKARAKRVRVVGHRGDATIVEMVLAEGKNREVRRMWAKLGHKVMSLSRVAIGPITIKGLKEGEWRELSAAEVRDLKRLAEGKPVPTAWFGAGDGPQRRQPPRRGPARHESAGETASGAKRGRRAEAALNRPGPAAVRGLGAGGGAERMRRPRRPARPLAEGVEEIEVTAGLGSGPGAGEGQPGGGGRRLGGRGPKAVGPRRGRKLGGGAVVGGEPGGRIILGIGRVPAAGEIPPPSRRKRPGEAGLSGGGVVGPAAGLRPGLKRRPRPLRARRNRPGGES